MSWRTRLALTAGAGLVAVAVVVGAQRWTSSPSDATVPSLDLRSATDRQLAALQGHLHDVPNDLKATAELGQLSLQKARESGDPSYYPRAEAAFRQVLDKDPHALPALEGMGSLALSRHQFAAGLDWGEQALALAPESAAALGVVVDAQVELGRYDEAVASTQRMVDLRPDLNSYARVSYLRELHGNLPAAIDAMRRAAEAGAPHQEGTAWTRVQLGNLYFLTGSLTQADVEYQRALAEVPDYLHALAGLGKVEAARGHYPSAIGFYQRATAQLPLPEYVIALGDAYQVAGQPQQAQEQYRLVEVEQRLFEANGVDLDLEIALFDLDHDRQIDESLARLKALARERPSVKVQDALAWGLYKGLDCPAAQQAMAQALRLGTRDPLLLFHAGLIAECAGRRPQARAYLEQVVTLNPAFSPLYAEPARQALTRLSADAAAATQTSGGAS